MKNQDVLSTSPVKFVSVLYLAVFLRPILIVRIPFEIAGFNLLEMFSIAVSCLLVMVLFINFKNIRINFISYLVFFFCLYCLAGLMWGASLKGVARMVLPFIFFFIVQAMVTDIEKLRKLLTFLMWGYFIFIAANMIDIVILKGGFSYKIYYTGLSRYEGLTGGTHTLAHSMFIFSVVFVFYKTQIKNQGKFMFVLSLIFLLMSYYCIYKTQTRTVFIGLALFWSLYLF